MARPRKNPKTVTKICEYCNNKFEANYYKRHIRRFCSKKCANACPDTKKKIVDSQKKTFNEKYGTDHPMKTEQTKQNFKKSMKQKYGVEHALQHKDCIQKLTQTKIQRYNDPNFNNEPLRKQTCIKKYGTENVRQSDYYKHKYKQTCIQKYGVEHASKSTSYKDSHKKLMFEKFIKNERFDNFTHMFSFDEYQGVTELYNKKYTFKCNRCGLLEDHDISCGKSLVCSKCDKKPSSNFQSDIVDFISNTFPSIPIIQNDRTVLYPKEIDILLPSMKIGIECDSLIYHSEIFGGKNKTYHLNKTRRAINKEINLIHITDYDWNNKTHIIKSMLYEVLNGGEKEIYSNDIRKIDKKTAKLFLDENHINGFDNSSIRYGIYYKGSLLYVATFRKCNRNKNEYYLNRFGSVGFIKIKNALKLIFNKFINEYNPNKITALLDRNYYSGMELNDINMAFIENTEPMCKYITGNYSILESQYNLTKQKMKSLLENYDPKLTNWENLKNNGFDRIWDCGTSKWIYAK